MNVASINHETPAVPQRRIPYCTGLYKIAAIGMIKHVALGNVFFRIKYVIKTEIEIRLQLKYIK